MRKFEQLSYDEVKTLMAYIQVSCDVQGYNIDKSFLYKELKEELEIRG